MFTKGNVMIFHTHVEPLSSGTRVFKESDHIVDIDELHKALVDSSSFVVVCNDVDDWSDMTKKQNFIVTDECEAEEGYEHTYMFAHWGRSLGGVTNRKIMMSFKGSGENAVLKASYFNA